MPPGKVNDEQLLEKLTRVFQEYGYEGASVTIISKATGLQRASLYHRFPAGKDQMAESVLARADERFAQHVLAPLRSDDPPADRVRQMGKRLEAYYDSGRRSCLLDVLSMGDATEALRTHVRCSFDGWREAMATVAVDAGCTRAIARRRATEALVAIQGTLVLARASGDTRPFRKTIADLPRLLTDADN